LRENLPSADIDQHLWQMNVEPKSSRVETLVELMLLLFESDIMSFGSFSQQMWEGKWKR
jgi:hypothetical protein